MNVLYIMHVDVKCVSLYGSLCEVYESVFVCIMYVLYGGVRERRSSVVVAAAPAFVVRTAL